VAAAVVGGQDRLEVERLALMSFPGVCGHDDEAGRCVAQAPIEHWRISIEIEEERCDFFLKSIQVEWIGGSDDARDLFSGRPE